MEEVWGILLAFREDGTSEGGIAAFSAAFRALRLREGVKSEGVVTLAPIRLGWAAVPVDPWPTILDLEDSMSGQLGVALNHTLCLPVVSNLHLCQSMPKRQSALGPGPQDGRKDFGSYKTRSMADVPRGSTLTVYL